MNISIKGKNILYYYQHFIMQLNHNAMAKKSFKIDGMQLQKKIITVDNVSLLKNSGFSIEIMKKYLQKQADKVKGFYFYNVSSDEIVGYLFFMVQGGNEIQYKVRTTDIFIFDVYVFEQFRGKGIAGYMISSILNDIEQYEKKKICLAVRIENESAIRAYKKMAFEVIDCKKFIRVCKINIPYHKV